MKPCLVCSVCVFRFVAKDSTSLNTVSLFLAIRESITGVASSDTEPDVNVNSFFISIEVRDVVDEIFENFDAISVFDVSFSGDDFFSNKEHSVSEKFSKYKLKEVYDVAALLARNEIVNREQGFDLYEQRIVQWGQICVLCSFDGVELTKELHNYCLQKQHRQLLNKLRRDIRFKSFIDCFNCGHIQVIYSKRGQKGGCVQL